MMKPDFNKMTRQELRAYVLENREDDDAIEVLIETANPGVWYPYPQTDEDLEKMHEILKNYLKKKQGN
ncbi:hypothetical protein NIES4071_78510 [Calothrix sp. NIES-4071]|nr:hypothetical protein NIES4071_78510 [Calothrix sp. NIES-4071]BAZ62123.1 hypothetical protein NIES4105_78440 [Calothrix sp. NIES-4105]